MAAPAFTRAQIRQRVARNLREPFYRKYDNSYSALTGTPTSEKLYDTTLKEANDFWKGAWALMTSGDEAGESREIVGFSRENNELQLSYPLSGAPSATETYEILNTFSPAEIHTAINDAIEESWPDFFDVTISEELVHQEDVLSYALSSLTTTPYHIAQVWIERIQDSIMGVATSSTATTIVDTSAVFTDVAAGWLVSIYSGTGKGQLRTVSSVSGTEITVSSAWTTNPDTTSKYRVWDPNDEDEDWRRVLAVRFDKKDWPTEMWLTQDYPALWGMRIRLVYVSKLTTLSSDSDSVNIPMEYLVSKVIEKLSSSLMRSSRVDRQLWQDMATIHFEKAERIRLQRAYQMPDGTLWQEEEADKFISSIDRADPLGWRR